MRADEYRGPQGTLCLSDFYYQTLEKLLMNHKDVIKWKMSCLCRQLTGMKQTTGI